MKNLFFFFLLSISLSAYTQHTSLEILEGDYLILEALSLDSEISSSTDLEGSMLNDQEELADMVDSLEMELLAQEERIDNEEEIEELTSLAEICEEMIYVNEQMLGKVEKSRAIVLVE